MKKILSFLLVLVLGLVFVGCTEKDVKPTKVNVTGANEVLVGATIKLEVEVLPADATDKSVTWESSDKAIATVEAGTVKGVKEGTVTITATSKADSAVKGEIKVTVKAAEQGHTHAFGEWVVVKEATEAEEGLKERTCECGEKETQKIDKLQHTHNFVDGKCECGAEEEHTHNYVDGKCECGAEEVELTITISGPYYVIAGESVILEGIIAPEEFAEEEVIWTSSDENILTVDYETSLIC